MNILICGGKKSEEVREQLDTKFSGGTIDFFALETLDDAIGGLIRGEKYDRLLLLEKSWGADKIEENDFRKLLFNFVQAAKEHFVDNASALFICTKAESAKIIYEETLELYQQCRILHLQPDENGRPPRFTVKLISDFATKDLDNLKDFEYDPDIEIRKQRQESEGLNFSTETIVGGHLPSLSEVDADNLDIEEPEEEFSIEEASDSSFDDDFEESDYSNSYYSFESDNLEDDYEENEDSDVEEDSLDDILGELGGIDHPIDTPKRETGESETSDGFIPVHGLSDDEEEQAEEEEEEPLFTDYRLDEDTPEKAYVDYKQAVEEDEEPLGSLGMIEDEPLGDLDDPDETEDFADLDISHQFGFEVDSEDDDKTEDDESELGELFNEEENTFNNSDDEEESILTQSDDELEESEAQESFEEETYKPAPSKKQKRFIRDNTTQKSTGLTENSLRKILDSFRGRGISILVTGTSNSGKTLLSYNMATILNKLGCSVLLVDLDLEKSGLSMIDHDTYEIVHSLNVHENSLKFGFNTVTSKVKGTAVVLRPALHLLTTGIASLPLTPEKLVESRKIARFGTAIKNSYHVTIYDVPFNTATTYFSDLIGTADFVVGIVNSTVKSLQEFMIKMSSIEDEDVMDMMFDKTQLIINHSNQVLSKFFGKKVKSYRQLLRIMDKEVENILGFQPDYLYESMHLSGTIPEIPNINEYYNKGQVADTARGDHLFRTLVENILLRKELQ